MGRPIERCAVVLLLCAIPAPLHAAEDLLAGRWEGAFSRSGSIQTIGLELTREGSGVRGTYDIPDLGLYDEPLAEVAYDPPALRFKLLYGVFTMNVHEDVAEMTGENSEWGPTVALHLKHVTAAPPRSTKEEVRFKNGDVLLAGTLVKPLGLGPHPAIVVIHGAGPLGRDGWQYRCLGDMFARHGIAALVYDKRGVGRSTGNTEAATFDDLAGDAAAAVEALSRRADVDRGRIGLFGSSQGGWLAPLAASRRAGVAFLILDKGTAVTVEEQELQRVEYGLRAAGFPEVQIADALAYTRLVFRAAYGGEGWAELEAATKRARDEKWAETVQLAETEKDLEGWRLQRFDPAPVLRRTTIPVLALFGGKDTLVPPVETTDRLRRYLEEAGNRDVTIRIFPELGHSRFLGQSLKGGRWDWPESYWIWDKAAPEFEQTVISWLTERLRIEERGRAR